MALTHKLAEHLNVSDECHGLVVATTVAACFYYQMDPGLPNPFQYKQQHKMPRQHIKQDLVLQEAWLAPLARLLHIQFFSEDFCDNLLGMVAFMRRQVDSRVNERETAFPMHWKCLLNLFYRQFDQKGEKERFDNYKSFEGKLSHFDQLITELQRKDPTQYDRSADTSDDTASEAPQEDCDSPFALPAKIAFER